MKIAAHVHNEEGHHQVRLRTNDNAHTITVPPKASGFGSSANGGELLFLALATCYCNDVYREAQRAGIEVVSVDVDVEGTFGGIGEPGIMPLAPAVANAVFNGTGGRLRRMPFTPERVLAAIKTA